LAFLAGIGRRLGQAGAALRPYPFILGDLVKIALAACLVSAGARLIRR
jgi:biotin transporter BioY